MRFDAHWLAESGATPPLNSWYYTVYYTLEPNGIWLKKSSFFRYLGLAWANLGHLRPKRRPKTSQERQAEAETCPKRVKMKPKDSSRESKWAQKASQNLHMTNPSLKTFSSQYLDSNLRQLPEIKLKSQDPPSALTRPSQARHQWNPPFLGQKGEASKSPLIQAAPKSENLHFPCLSYLSSPLFCSSVFCFKICFEKPSNK